MRAPKLQKKPCTKKPRKKRKDEGVLRDKWGASICEHGRRRSQCKDCGGASICKHGRRRSTCTECVHITIPSSLCQACGSKTVCRIKDVPSTMYCAECREGYNMQRIKKWEVQTEAWLDESGLIWSHSNRKLPCAPTTRYPDYMFVGTEHCVLLEVDEHQHEHYNPSCEVARISELMDSIDFKNLHVVRYNPNAKGKTCDKKRVLLNALKDALSTNFGMYNDTGCVVQYLGYDEDRTIMLDELSCELQDIPD